MSINNLYKKKKICIICEKEFEPSIYNKKLCSDECRLIRRRQWSCDYHKKYYHSSYKDYYKDYYKKNIEQIKRNKKRWYKTKKGKKYIKKVRSEYNAKLRNKKWIVILPNIFPSNISVDYHHVDGRWFVVPLPTDLHRSTSGKLPNHIADSNDWVEFYYDFNINEFLNNDLMEIEK